MRFLIFMLIGGWTAGAAADLYRWVDPDTGSVKFSSYPPPWYGDPAMERRAPKVEVIPERGTAPSSGTKLDDRAAQGSNPAGKPPAKPDPSAMKGRPADGR